MLEGVPPSNIWNFDETCLESDPGRLQCIMKRETYYLKQMMNHAKAGVSIMFCENAEGEPLPPYCYISQLLQLWTCG